MGRDGALARGDGEAREKFTIGVRGWFDPNLNLGHFWLLVHA
jgi:hypothetical protein